MKNQKKIKLILLSILLLFGLTFTTFKLRADSGWDSDWDSGSSWDSGSDWGSSSWDSDYGYSSYSSSPDGGSFITFIIIVAIIIYVIYTSNKGANNTAPTNTNIYPTLTQEDIRKVLPEFNKQEFLSNAYDIFINVQNAWSEFNYDELRKYLSDELFNTYKSQLRVLNAKKQKNLMHDFVKYNMDITRMENVDNKTTLTVELIVSFYDYLVDSNNNVVRGTKSRKLTNHYELTFICSKAKKNKSNKCPNCNAPLEKNNSNVCPYCKSTIVSEHYDWIMSKKEIKK